MPIYLATTFLTAAAQQQTEPNQTKPKTTRKSLRPPGFPFPYKKKKPLLMAHLSDVDVMQKKPEKSGAEGICVGVANMTPLSAYKLQKAKSQARAEPKKGFYFCYK